MSPFLVVYWVYRALKITTLWVEFSPDGLRVRKLMGITTHTTDEVSGLRFDNQPISMASTDVGVRIPVSEARYVSVHSRGGNTLARVRVTSADRSRLVRFLKDQGGRHWLPK